mmetsp:Transcript_17104/g.33408  ORF Transcript_17104/g.33408 Transcript_17104/m.33408 type:complete len:567 (+) Transcript_17104:80-1780(+)
MGDVNGKCCSDLGTSVEKNDGTGGYSEMWKPEDKVLFHTAIDGIEETPVTRLQRACDQVEHALSMVEEFERRPSPVPEQLKASVLEAKELLAQSCTALEGYKSRQCAQLSCCDAQEQLLRKRYDDLRQWQDRWIFDINDVLRQLNVGKMGQRKSWLGDFDGAYEVFSEGLRAQPHDPFLLGQRGRVQMQRHRDAEAMKDFAGAVRYNPNDALAQAFVLFVTAQALFRQMDSDSVPRRKRRTREQPRMPSVEEEEELDGQAGINNQALPTAVEEQIAETDTPCATRETTEEGGSETDAFPPHGGGSLESTPRSSARKRRTSLESPEEAWTPRSSTQENQDVIGRIVEAQHCLDAAFARLASVEAAGPDVQELKARAHILYTKVLMAPEAQALPGALQHLNAALVLRPENSEARGLRSQICDDLGMLDLKHLNEVIENDPNNVDALTTRCHLLLKQGELNSALADIDRALTLSPDGLDCWLVSSMVKQNFLKLPEALEDCFRAQALQPDNEEVRNRIKELRELMRGVGEDISVASEGSSAPLLSNSRGPGLRNSLRMLLQRLPGQKVN